ncbi:hypothetical protein JY403_04430 [Fusobacterium animalis]|uniref:hypothetical protein n=1 Tax=Fusobacterium animalis TaxID=76859 RepID=UPI001C6EBF80|nr:hypothetical protein [Fusobacterium animalis]QYR66516.1 hypothetical protein JY403_04430 [Fusobacterium animalis]
MILLFLLSFSILPIILGFLEIFLVKKVLTIKTMKYIKLLKIFELITPFIALINPQGTGKIAGRVLPIFFLLSLTYFIVLVYDFFKGKIDGNEFIINFIFYFLDVIFTFLSILLAILVIF